ncbi:MAG: hypothetical protein LC122_12635 [Chitinophagales bacterium]|nr:hypothetical protein [Chitinophagales bacterium]
MNYLTNNICRYIFENFGIFSEKKFSIISDDFKLDKGILFDDKKNNIYGVEYFLDDFKIEILCADCTIDSKEYAMYVGIDNGGFGLFLSEDYECGNISYLFENKYVEASVQQQANLLSSLEALKNYKFYNLELRKVSDYSYNELIKYIEHVVILLGNNGQ